MNKNFYESGQEQIRRAAEEADADAVLEDANAGSLRSSPRMTAALMSEAFSF